MGLEQFDLDDFEIGDLLGRGGTAHVLAAHHRQTGYPVALKLLEPAYHDSAELRERLYREAVMLAEVRSPHVGQMLGFGYHGEQPFVVLEQLRGETLAERFKRDGRIPLSKLADWLEQLLVGLRDSHAAGIIHRDVKPPNIFLAENEPTSRAGFLAPSGDVDEIDIEIDVEDEDGLPLLEAPSSRRAGPRDERGEDEVRTGEVPVAQRAPFPRTITVKLIDFGVARLEELAQEGREELTSPQHVLGSVAFMAPEQFDHARDVGVEADLYAVGVIAFRAIAGRLPFVHRSIDVVASMKRKGGAPRVSSLAKESIPAAFDAFVARALEPDPALRFASAAEMLEALWRATAQVRGEAQLDARGHGAGSPGFGGARPARTSAS